MVRKVKNKKNKQAEKDLKQKLGLFDQLPEECLASMHPLTEKIKNR